MTDYSNIYDYIDGELSPEHEENLFREMASNEDMRLKMRQMMAIKTAVREKTSVYNPPAESTAAVFSRLGFSPAGVTGYQQALTFGQKARHLAKKYYQAAIIAGMAIIIAFLLMDNDTVIIKHNSLAETTGIQQKNNIPVTTSKETTDKPGEIAKPPVQYIVVSEKPSGVMKDNTADNKTQNIKKSTPNFLLAQSINPLFSNVLRGSSTIPSLNYKSEKSLGISDYEDKKLGLMIEVRGSQYWSMPEETISPPSKAWFTDNAVSIFYMPVEELAFGLDFRQENFFQRFDGMDPNAGQLVTYEQQPNLTTISGAVRYIYPLSEDFHPYFQLTGGWNRVGITGRMMGGLEYSPYPAVSFIIAVEYSYLGYEFQDEQFDSKKIGIHYGASVKF